MVEFITWLKALAAILITNSHLGHVYPVDALATGGLLGNLLFFAVSGFCLYNIKLPFHKWYIKRLFRIYPAVWIATIVCLAWGTYHVDSLMQGAQLFLYPTYYHFIASILILYVPFYMVARHSGRVQNPQKFLITIGVLLSITYILVYTTVYDTSYYHIDTVEEPMILFVYFTAMLMGAGLRTQSEPQSFNWLVPMGLLISLIAYACTKVCVGNGHIPPWHQYLNQISILALVWMLLQTGRLINPVFKTVPSVFRKSVSFIASITLEIYLVQYLVLRSTTVQETAFPGNLLFSLVSIVSCAYILHHIVIIAVNYLFFSHKTSKIS